MKSVKELEKKFSSTPPLSRFFFFFATWMCFINWINIESVEVFMGTGFNFNFCMNVYNMR